MISTPRIFLLITLLVCANKYIDRDMFILVLPMFQTNGKIRPHRLIDFEYLQQPQKIIHMQKGFYFLSLVRNFLGSLHKFPIAFKHSASANIQIVSIGFRKAEISPFQSATKYLFYFTSH